MKAQIMFSLTLLATISLVGTGCIKDECTRRMTYTQLEPIFVKYSDLHTGTVKSEQPRPLKNPGALYYYNDLIFVNEKQEGIHVIDNSDPTLPVNAAFISIPGNMDFAIKDGIIYANSYLDLLSINLLDYQLINRTENVFPSLWDDAANSQVFVGYKENLVTEEVTCDDYSQLVFFDDKAYRFEGDFANMEDVAESNTGAGGTGIGGSFARFTIVGEHLYVVDQTSLRVFGLASPAYPVLANTVDLGWGIETIFPHEDKLFIGSNSGMFIFDNSNPEMPVQLAAFQHANACDPVFVKGNYAYVTLRSGNACAGFTNQLDLVDISSITNPVLVKSFPMQNPHGLAIKGSNLFLCEGNFGLKSFDISDPKNLDQYLLDHETSLHAVDAIALPGQGNPLLVIGREGFYQYDMSDPANLKLLSLIPVGE